MGEWGARPYAKNYPPPYWRSMDIVRVRRPTKFSIIKARTASILANVFDNIEINTGRVMSSPVESEYTFPRHSDLLVNNKVFDRAAKPVIKNGPKIGWKLDA